MRRTTGRQASRPEKLPSTIEGATSCVNVANEKKSHRVRFSIEQEEMEVQEGISENPSLDAETQNAILMDYRKLHDQFKAEGLYQCNYTAYAWELLRYCFLFAVFAYLLYVKWYILSSVFLGLFWVGSTLSLGTTTADKHPATDHVYSTRRWPSRHYRKLRLRYAYCCFYRRLLLWPEHWLVEVQSQHPSSRNQHA